MTARIHTGLVMIERELTILQTIGAYTVRNRPKIDHREWDLIHNAGFPVLLHAVVVTLHNKPVLFSLALVTKSSAFRSIVTSPSC